MLVSAAPPRVRKWQTGTIVDPNLVNAWGLTASGTSPWWSADNGTGKSTRAEHIYGEAAPRRFP